MFPTAQKSPHPIHHNGGNQISHSDNAARRAACPSALTFRMPDGASFRIVEIDPSLTLKDIANHLHEKGGNSTRAFPSAELGRSFNFLINGIAYPANRSLSAIHEELNLNDCQEVACITTEARHAADALKLHSGSEWRVLNENTVMLDSSPYQKREEAVAFAESILKSMPNLAHRVGMQIKTMEHYFYAEMSIRDRQSIRAVAKGIPPEIILSGPIIAQALRGGDPAGLSMLPLDVLCRLGMFLAPEGDEIDGYRMMNAEIDHASAAYHEATVFRKTKPVDAGAIEKSVAATASGLLRGGAADSLKIANQASVFNVNLSASGMTLDFNHAAFAGKFIRTMRAAGYRATSLDWKEPDAGHGQCVARLLISDFNEVKRFVERTCGFTENATKELFETGREGLRIPARFFVKELEAIGEWVEPMNLDDKKSAAKRLIEAYLPCLDRKQAVLLKDAVWEKSRNDESGQPGTLRYLREKRGAGRLFSVSNYSDNVATFKEIIAAIEKIK